MLGILAAAQLSDYRVCTFEKNLKLCKPKELKNLQKGHEQNSAWDFANQQLYFIILENFNIDKERE